MYLNSLKLQNFRNYQQLVVQFPDKIVALVGANATGKTNLLEAIRFLSLFKSWRATHSPDLIRWGNSFARVEGEIDDSGQIQKITSALIRENTPPSAKRLITLNGAKVLTRAAVGKFLTVLFSPDDLLLISAGPKERRRYLDIVLGQVSPRYFESLQRYNQALEQRNMLIFNNSQTGSTHHSEAEIWEFQMATEGSRLIKERSHFIEELNRELSRDYQSLSQDSAHLHLVYQPALINPGVESLVDIKQLFGLLQASWKKNWPRDLATKQTTIGPHRDDFTFVINNRPVERSGSRGEWRSAVLALKLGEKKFIEAQIKKTPTLLLDDVFSELDLARQIALAKRLGRAQCFLTTSDVSVINTVLGEPAAVYQVARGKINKQYE